MGMVITSNQGKIKYLKRYVLLILRSEDCNKRTKP